MPPTNFYSILEIPLTATPDQIKSAFKKLIKKHHPDKNSSSASNQTTIEILRAYRLLSDPKRRADYDQILKARIPKEPSRDIFKIHCRDFIGDNYDNVRIIGGKNITLTNCKKVLLNNCTNVRLENCEESVLEYCNEVILNNCNQIHAYNCEKIDAKNIQFLSLRHCTGDCAMVDCPNVETFNV